MILFSPYILNGITYFLSGVLAYLELILIPHVCLHPHPSVSGLDHFPQLTSHLCLSPRPLQSPFFTEQAIRSVFFVNCIMSLLCLTPSDHSPLKGNKLHVPHCGQEGPPPSVPVTLPIPCNSFSLSEMVSLFADLLPIGSVVCVLPVSLPQIISSISCLGLSAHGLSSEP